MQLRPQTGRQKKIHTFVQTQRSVEVGLCFLLHSFHGQEQSPGALLNVFIVLSWAQELGFATGYWTNWFSKPKHLIQYMKPFLYMSDVA